MLRQNINIKTVLILLAASLKTKISSYLFFAFFQSTVYYLFATITRVQKL